MVLTTQLGVLTKLVTRSAALADLWWPDLHCLLGVNAIQTRINAVAADPTEYFKFFEACFKAHREAVYGAVLVAEDYW